MKWNLTILGSSSALPTDSRFLSAQLLHTAGHYFLFDCGEGTQFQLRKYRAKISSIDAVFISHLHGDHVLGLFGLLSTYHMLNREAPLHIYAFGELEDVTHRVLRMTNTRLRFPLVFHPLDVSGLHLLTEDDELEVYSFPLRHSVPVCGFLVKQKKGRRRIRKEFVAGRSIAPQWFPRLIAGEDFIDEDGTVIPNDEITYELQELKSYAYCSDTAFMPETASVVQGVSLLYHEATFGDAEAGDAEKKKHSTASQAAMTARDAGARQLLIGHFSTRYATTDHLVREAQRYFDRVTAAEDGLVVEF